MIGLLLSIIYLSFFGLGLPDSMLGAAWPTIFAEMDVPVSGAGIISAIIAFGTIISSLASDRVTRKLGASKTTAISVAITALALLGFGISTKFWHLCLISIPYGLGAGSVDAALNNYVSLHFSSKHMNWLHCMWGLGAAVGGRRDPDDNGRYTQNGNDDDIKDLAEVFLAFFVLHTLSIPFAVSSLPTFKKFSFSSANSFRVFMII